MKKAILAFSLTLMASGIVHAQTTPTIVTTQTLTAACKNSASTSDQAFCHGFAQGVYDTYIISRHPKNNPEFICFKEKKITGKQAMTNFLAWSDVNPKYAEKSAADTLLRYMAHTYPCES